MDTRVISTIPMFQAHLVGHHNTKQKIKYVERMREEMTALKKEVAVLRAQVAFLQITVVIWLYYNSGNCGSSSCRCICSSGIGSKYLHRNGCFRYSRAVFLKLSLGFDLCIMHLHMDIGGFIC